MHTPGIGGEGCFTVGSLIVSDDLAESMKNTVIRLNSKEAV